MPRKKKSNENDDNAKVAESTEKSAEEKISDAEKSKKSSKKRTSDRSVLLKELKEKAKMLAEKIEGGVKTEELKEEFEQKLEMLVPLDNYTVSGIHLGTKVITPSMRKYVYRRRADSIAVLNTSIIDDQIKKAIKFLSQYSPEDVILVCKREAGWDAAKVFSEATGIKALTKKYPGGMLTNTELEQFYEPEIVIVCDPWVDRNALGDAIKTNKKVIMLADTNNFIKKADLIIPCNNKSSKSLGLIFYLLARGYIEKRKMKNKMPSINTFVGDDWQEV